MPADVQRVESVLYSLIWKIRAPIVCNTVARTDRLQWPKKIKVCVEGIRRRNSDHGPVQCHDLDLVMMPTSAPLFDRLRSMFDFFFKRARSRAATNAGAPNSTAVAAPAPSPALASGQRRQQALDAAAALGSDESVALAFILSCGVPEARLCAAQLLHSRSIMEQAQKAMRETDRRVAKLMQQRLSELVQRERSQLLMQAAIARAQGLVADATVLPNQVVELDRAWAEAGSGTAALEADFVILRTELGQRLQAQAALQRRVMDLVVSMQAALTTTDGQTVAELDAVVLKADAVFDTVERDRALPSLPRHLLPEVMATRARLQERHAALKASEAAVVAREQALHVWESALAATDNGDVGSDVRDDKEGGTGDSGERVSSPREALTAQSIRQQWRLLPAIQDAQTDAALQARFDALLARLTPVSLPKRTAGVMPDRAHAAARDPSESSPVGIDAAQSRAVLTAALEELHSALNEGALQRAVEQDRLLRSLITGAVALTSDQYSALSAARAELTRLQGWAKWGGTVSREELVVAVEGLLRQGLGVLELGKKVGSMRERWRALDATAGPAPRQLWLRFDAACGAAYAPVAAHFAELAQQREARVEKAKAILAEIAAFITDAGLGGQTLGANDTATVGAIGAAETAAPDWRAIAAFCQRMKQDWQRLGPLERKQQKQLSAAFEQALQPLLDPLKGQQEHAIAHREVLINSVTQLAPQGRETLDQLQSLQATWQQHAKAFPLARAQEQELWQRFRGACDAVFAQRKQRSVDADADRNANQIARTAICVALEGMAADADATDSARAVQLRDQRAAWTAIGPVPRAAQTALQARFDQAVATLQAQRDMARNRAAQLQLIDFDTALASCLASERQLLSSTPTSEQVAQPLWTPPTNLPAPLAQAFHARFEKAQAALAPNDQTYGQDLQQNQIVLETALLRLEVRLGLDSPPGLTRERLQLQVTGLQSTFKSGGAATADDLPVLQLARVCALAAATDAVAQNRLSAIAKVVLTHQ